MGGGIEVLVVFWNEWGIHALVLLSFTLQVILLITADTRRRRDSGMLRVVVWSAYLLADTTAIYTLGHMSVSSRCGRRLPEHELMAFWAPFLLLHLGGQDNITAYSIEDNRLWLRHLQSFTVQIIAAGYVLHESSIVARPTLLRPAAILMFVVGALKYGERVWALKCASTSNLSGKNYKSYSVKRVRTSYLHSWFTFTADHEGLVCLAHQLLKFPKNLITAPTLLVVFCTDDMQYRDWGEMYQVAEVQLSLTYDVLYSKAPVIHTWYGLCIHGISSIATVAAFMLFRRFIENDGYYYSYNGVDVATTNVLLAGAVVLEITSLVRAIFSSWTDAKIARLSSVLHARHPGEARVMLLFLSWLRPAVNLPRYLVRCAMRRVGLTIRYWSGSMGQHNIIHMCTQSRVSWSSKIARWMGREDWWNTLVYTSSIPVPGGFSEMLQSQLLRSRGVVRHDNPDHIFNSQGRAVLKRMGMSQDQDLGSWIMDLKLEESILVWHIATHVYLCWYDEEHSARPDLAKAIEVLSNYMTFLLVARPYMLPESASRIRYLDLCSYIINDLAYSSAEDLVKAIRRQGEALNHRRPPVSSSDDDRGVLTYNEGEILHRASQLTVKLIGKELDCTTAAGSDMLDLISQVWVEMLCYASYRCKEDSHARHLNHGGEIMTVVAILMKYASFGIV